MKASVLRRQLEDFTVAHCGFEERGYLGMSQIWRCPVALYEQMVQKREQPGLLNGLLYYEGYLHKLDVLRRLELLGLWTPLAEIVAAWDGRFRGHPDGELAENGRAVLLQVKSLAPEAFELVRKGEIRRRDYDQVQIYMRHGGYLQAMVVYKCRSSGRMWPFEVDRDRERQDVLDRKARQVLAAVDGEGKRSLRCECGRH